MKEVVMMSKEEYEKIQKTIVDLQRDVIDKENDISLWRYYYHIEETRANRLWDALNRPAIQELQDKHDQEYYTWCDEIAQKYEKLDEEEWITSRARFYNNGRAEFCACHECAEEDVELLWKYDGYSPEVEYEKTEGWSDLKRYHNSNSWILSHAEDDVWKRYMETDDKCLFHQWRIFQEMKREGASVDPHFGGFYR